MAWRKPRLPRVPMAAKIEAAYTVLLEEDDDMSTEQLFARIGDLTGADMDEIVSALVDLEVTGRG